MDTDFIKTKLEHILTNKNINHKNEIIKQKTLKNAHIYCKVNNITGQSLGPLIEYYIQYHFLLKKNKASECIGDLNNGKINYEIKASNGGQENNKFNYVQLRVNHKCNYILTAYHINEENIDNFGELYVFTLNKEQMINMIYKYGNYAHGTIKKLGKINIEDLYDANNNKEYSIRPKIGDKCWNELMSLQANIEDILN